MARIIWTESALLDLDDIAGYIALDNPYAAKRLAQHVFDSVARLEEFPNSGRLPPEIRDSRYREVIVGPCRIFYRHTDDIVFVLYIMRSERQLRNFILRDRDDPSS